MLGSFKNATKAFPDYRKGNNRQYSMTDFALSAFSVFFMQCPSFLAHQNMMKKARGESNAETLFQIDKLPSDNHIRRSLDLVDPSYLFPIFDNAFKKLEDTGEIEKFKFLNNQLLITFDGTEHTSSNHVNCDKCSTRKHRNGVTDYFHSSITPVVVQPSNDKVISLPPEFIIPQDGNKKQDCERNAFARWLDKHSDKYVEHEVTALGDDLYCNQPTIQNVLAKAWNYIFICKPKSHKGLYEWISLLKSGNNLNIIEEVKTKGTSQKTYTYQFVNGVPLKKGDSISTNWCQLIITNADGKQTFKTACATNHPITKENVKDIILASRSRWKIENENNNTLKTKGYHLEHNFGHGKEHLTSIFVTMNILAFLFHTIMHIFDKAYKVLRKALGRRDTFFQDIRALTRYELFKSWSNLLKLMLERLEINLEPD